MSGRRGDWEQALSAYLAACETKPHVYGKHDCLLFAAGGALAMTGVDPAAEIRGTYRSQAGSVRALKRDGEALGHAGTLEAAISARLPEIPASFARRGDWALHEGSVGIIAGPFALFVGAVVEEPLKSAQYGAQPAERPGLIRVPRSAWEKAWRVE